MNGPGAAPGNMGCATLRRGCSTHPFSRQAPDPFHPPTQEQALHGVALPLRVRYTVHSRTGLPSPVSHGHPGGE